MTTALTFPGQPSWAAAAPVAAWVRPVVDAMCARAVYAYRDGRDAPPDVDFRAGVACPVCSGYLRSTAAGWACVACVAGWDWRGVRGRWLPTPRPFVLTGQTRAGTVSNTERDAAPSATASGTPGGHHR